MMKSIIVVFAILITFTIIDEAFAKNYPSWVNNIFVWYENGEISEQEMKNAIGFLDDLGILDFHECSGNARCITGSVTSVIDGDTIKIDGQSIRFALASAPELNEFNGPEARNFIDEICPVGSVATADEDDGQTEGSYGRILGMIYCNGLNLNSELLDSGLGYLSSGFCGSSEFASHLWAIKHGC